MESPDSKWLRMVCHIEVMMPYIGMPTPSAPYIISEIFLGKHMLEQSKRHYVEIILYLF